MLVARQTIERPGFDRVDDLLRGSPGRHKIKPAPRRELRVIESQNVFRNRIAAAETVEEPAVEFVLLQGLLKRFDVCFIHEQIIRCHRHKARGT